MNSFASVCGPFNSIVEELFFYGVLDRVDANCYSVTTEFRFGAYVFIFCGALFILFNTFGKLAVRQYFYNEKPCTKYIRSGEQLTLDAVVTDDDTYFAALK